MGLNGRSQKAMKKDVRVVSMRSQSEDGSRDGKVERKEDGRSFLSQP